MNDANKAGFDEINGHIQLIKVKLANNSSTEAKASLLQDLEDYYERGMQLRVMHNTTLTESLNEEVQQNRALKRRVRQLVAVGVVSLLLTLLGCVVTLCPECLSRAAKSTRVQQLIVMMTCFVVGGVCALLVVRRTHSKTE